MMQKMYDQLSEALTNMTGVLSEKEMEQIQKHTTIREIPAKERIIVEGATARKMYFLLEGAVRYYHYHDGIEKTIWFSFENSFITSFYSYISGQKSKETVETLEDSILIEFSKEQLVQLIKQYPTINAAYINVLEDTVIKKELALQRDYYTAAEKYENLLMNFPHIIQRVSLGHIASYMGVNQSTLSRIRNPKT